MNDDPAAIIKSIEARLGRPLRVLHIGNIANNAYNNAKIQRQFGIEADVISYDYYHIMSCPEWEDAQFEGDVDHFFPDWFQTNLKGWSRPRWFVQGPAEICLQYLRAQRLGLKLTTELLWRHLEATYWHTLRTSSPEKGRKASPMPLRLSLASRLVERFGIAYGPDRSEHAQMAAAEDTISEAAVAEASDEIASKTAETIAEIAGTEPLLREEAAPDAAGPDEAGKLTIELKEPAESSECPPSGDLQQITLREVFRAVARLPYGLFIDRGIRPAILKDQVQVMSVRLWRLSRKVRRRVDPPNLRQHFEAMATNFDSFKEILRRNYLIRRTVRSYYSWLYGFSRSNRIIRDLIRYPIRAYYKCYYAIVNSPSFLKYKIVYFFYLTMDFVVWRSSLLLFYEWNAKGEKFDKRYSSIRSKLSSIRNESKWADRRASSKYRRNESFCELNDVDSDIKIDVLSYIDHHSLRFFDVMTTYDVIQGYSIDGFIPYMNGITRFASYEHGTIRDLPWQPTLIGVVCKKVYEESPVVFVTNSDVLPSVERLGLEPDRVVYLPHAFDDSKLRRFRAENPNLLPPTDIPVFFSPTRHHWKDKSGSWTKGNDVFLRAAGVLAREGLPFRITLVEWGREVEESRALIEELGIADRVTWIPTMQKRELWAAYCRSNAVVDQFTLPALGGVGFEVMALGRRLLTALDMDQLQQFFGAAPPCLPARAVDECVARMREVIADPADLAGCGAAASMWMERYHSAKRIVALQAAAYEKLLRTTSLAPWEQP